MRTTLVTVFAGITLLTLAACTSLPPVSEIPDAIVNAKTAADHQRIADYFAQKAASYEAEVRLHEKMSQSYLGGHPRYSKFDFEAMSSHCQILQKEFIVAAREAKALAQVHRDLGASLN